MQQRLKYPSSKEIMLLWSLEVKVEASTVPKCNLIEGVEA
jgi:hypothetical protein